MVRASTAKRVVFYWRSKAHVLPTGHEILKSITDVAAVKIWWKPKENNALCAPGYGEQMMMTWSSVHREI